LSLFPHPVSGQVGGAPFFDPGWVVDNLDDLWEATVEHLLLTGVSVAAGLVISLALAAVALRWKASFGPLTQFASVLYTIPSLATFALLWPLLGGVRNKFTIAVVALTSYTILILLRNIVTGIEGVSADVREAAVGMGYRPVPMFLKVQLPLALPAIIAGVRIATVTVVGLVTVTALIGLGGVGALILDGFRRGPLPTQVMTGILASVLLASLFDFLLLRLERVLTPWRRNEA
jgi:osmoprotectant transport system permease protein